MLSGKRNYQKHVMTHFGPLPFKCCGKCTNLNNKNINNITLFYRLKLLSDKKFANSSGLIKHREIYHFYNLCKLCQIPLNSINGYVKHCNELHSNNSIVCPMCKLDLSDNSAATSHFHLHSLKSSLCKKCDIHLW